MGNSVEMSTWAWFIKLSSNVISKNILWTFVKLQRLIFVTCCVAMETM